MKIVAGLSRIDDYIRLVKAGADEVFIGYVPYKWTKKYGNLFPINRREVLYFNAQIKSLSDMKILKKMVDVYKVPVSITFNNIYYLEEQYAYIAEIIKELIGIGFEKFIIADISLLLYLKQHNIHCSVHLSGECAETNRLSMKFFKDLNITRYIFNRKTTVDEMKSCINYSKSILNSSNAELENFDLKDKAITNPKPVNYDVEKMKKLIESKAINEVKSDVDETKSLISAYDSSKDNDYEFEAFVLNERCHYTGAFCSSFHCDEMIHLCEMPYSMGKVDEFSFDFPETDEKLEKHYESRQDSDFNEEDIKPQDLDVYKLGSTGCGLCSLKKLQMSGVTHLKVVGRGNYIENMEEDVRSLKKAISLLDKTDDCKKYETVVKKKFFKGKCTENCYYNNEI
ncbi:MAG: U32 family peptidase [Clostridium sp.]|nr:U32 family peptidase [Clostridium sp.]